MKTWCVIKLGLQRASAKQNDIIYGPPAPSAAYGFMKALSLATGYPLLTGAAYIVRNYAPIGHGRYNRFDFALQRSAARDANVGLQADIPRCYLQVTLVAQFEIPEGEDATTKIQSQSRPMRFANGTIEYCKIHLKASLADALKFAGRGFTPYPLTDVDISSADKLVTLLGNREKGSGWKTPVSIGYRLIEKPSHREGARKGLPHAYADTLTGVVAWESIANHRRGANKAPLTFWEPHWLTQDTILYFKTQS